MSGWISTKYFSEGVDFFQRNKIMQEYADSKWDLCKAYLCGRHRITRNGIIISEKVKDQLGLILFPMIFVTATKGYSESAKFIMMDERVTHYLFSDVTTKYVAKKIKLEEHMPDYTQDIWIEIIRAKKTINN